MEQIFAGCIISSESGETIPVVQLLDKIVLFREGTNDRSHPHTPVLPRVPLPVSAAATARRPLLRQGSESTGSPRYLRVFWAATRRCPRRPAPSLSCALVVAKTTNSYADASVMKNGTKNSPVLAFFHPTPRLRPAVA